MSRRRRASTSSGWSDLFVGLSAALILTLGAIALVSLLGLAALAWLLKDLDLSWTKGRPLRGRRRLVPAAGGARPLEVAAAHWRKMAADEYESVAAFSELSLDLLAAGAPSELVRDCHRGALDELQHTTLCLDMARRLDGTAASLPVTPQLRATRSRPWRRSMLVARLAVESAWDGCLGEAAAAHALEALSSQVGDPTMREVVGRLARDEHRHARLGLRVAQWGLEQDVPGLRAAIGFILAWAGRRSAAPPGALLTGLEVYGVVSDAHRAHGRQQALHEARAALGLWERGARAPSPGLS